MPYAPRKLSRAVALLSLMGVILAGCSDSKDDGDVATPTTVKANQPNVMLLVFDDVGYADMSPWGGEIAVPNIEALAKSGVTLTDFHGAPSCSPSRSMYLTGNDNHKAGLGNMGETLLPAQMGKEGYEGVLNNRVSTVAEDLKAGGYHTYMTGKWHLGGGDQDPYKRGFEETFTLMQGVGGHFETQTAFEGARSTYTQNGQEVPAPNGEFDAAHDTDKLMEFIDKNQADGKPFFAHWAVRMAHDPLQAPTDLIDSFKGKYDVGYDVIRQQRIDRMKQTGLIAQDTVASPRDPSVPAWDTLSPEEQARQAREMEVYAAMITAGDMEVGRFVDHLKSIGRFDNTNFILMSDNGPNAETIEFYGADQINARYNNAFDNIGHHDSFVMYGPGWAQASAGPLRLWKGFETEGGTRTGMIVSGPGLSHTGEKTDLFTNGMDVTPTILDMAGVKHPDTLNGQPILAMQGTSMLPFLKGDKATIHDDTEAIGAEMWGRAALRQGDYKILWIEAPFGSGKWDLYNVKTDPGEGHDLSAEQPDRYNSMLASWDKYVKDNGLLLFLGAGIGG